MMKYNDEYKLCYVHEQWAYFTTQEVTQQWGDDWNDAPYEHNAGTPYTWHEGRPEPPYKIAMVAFDAHVETPDVAYWKTYSPYSVESINKGLTPWLKSEAWVEDVEKVEIWAGTPYPEFVKLIQKSGGNVYEPLETHVLAQWLDAPEWAMWWAVDANGDAWWFTAEPKLNENFWGDGDDIVMHHCKVNIPLGVDWRLLKMRRPEEEIK